MKTLLTLAVSLLAATAVHAQTVTPPDDAMQTQITQNLVRQPPSQSLLTPRFEKANEIRRNGLSYSGILVELAKTGHPLELINPAAPAEYGSAEDNTARDPITHRVSGLKLFSIQF